MDNKKLSVRLHGIEVGILEERNGKMRFKYNSDADYQISLSLPIRHEAYNEKECRGYFGGLLSENKDIRKALALKYKISENSDFAMLRAVGRDCAGAISFHEPSDVVNVEIYNNVNLKMLRDTEVLTLIEELPTKPYAGRRMSLAGVQEKTSVCFFDDQIALPQNDYPTTHILKPATKFRQSVYNEYICMKSAKKLGLEAANVFIKRIQSTEMLLIERFDRYKSDGNVMRLQQEDFAQSKGIWSENKYNFSFKDCLSVLEQLDNPAYQKKKFISYVIFNFLMGNCDAHAKNFSIIFTGSKNLAPLYDVLCTSVYDLDNDMAMKIGNSKYAKEVTSNDWELFAQDLDVSLKYILDEVKWQALTLPSHVEKTVREVDVEIGYEILKIVKENCERTLSRL